tara:strand:+ start:256 stop:702 length:447 start_codon:yes stop_codon:yes gene_type:complete
MSWKNKKQAGYSFQDWKSQEFPQQNFLNDIINQMSGASTSSWSLAHEEIDKLIANADSDAAISKISREADSRYLLDLYRVLNPDSTIKLLTGQTQRWGGNPSYSPSERTRLDVINQLTNNPENPGLNKQDASWRLARARNNPFIPNKP